MILGPATWIDRSLDHVRLPMRLDPTAAFAKDWLHLNLFDHASGAVGLINASMHGDPSTATAIVVGSALFHHPRAGWFGGADVQDAASAYVDLAGFGLRSVGLVFTEDGGVAVSVARPGIEASLTAHPVERAIIVEERLPFGPGWISWRAVPGSVVEGRLQLSATTTTSHGSPQITTTIGAGGAGATTPGGNRAPFGQAARPGLRLVAPTNRAHTTGASLLSIHSDGRERRFSGPALRVERRGRWNGDVNRVPGATAALRADVVPVPSRPRGGQLR